ncbi:MAG TPA: hypothetical protein VKU79_06570 [Thermoplasmataceae archaeon]|nr:hypothetical protein [Thermoplasmataceae archaeon]
MQKEIVREQGKDRIGETEPRNFRNPDPLNCGLEGRFITVSMVNGRVESGKCTRMGQFFMEIVMGNGKPIIIAKSAVVTVSVL